MPYAVNLVCFLSFCNIFKFWEILEFFTRFVNPPGQSLVSLLFN